MRTHSYELTEDFAQAIRAVKAGKQVFLTEKGIPIAMIEPLRPASEEEERVILEMIDSGELQPTRKSGVVRQWTYKAAARRKAA